MQKSVIVKEEFMNINMKNISAALSEKQKHLKSLSQIFFSFSAAMCNAKQVAACTEFTK